MKKEIVDNKLFEALDIRVGTVVEAAIFESARKPAIKLWIDFGEEIGVLKSSAQITKFYQAEHLVGEQILAVVNFKPRQIGNFMSQCLVLGIYHNEGVVLVAPKTKCINGEQLG